MKLDSLKENQWLFHSNRTLPKWLCKLTVNLIKCRRRQTCYSSHLEENHLSAFQSETRKLILHSDAIYVRLKFDQNINSNSCIKQVYLTNKLQLLLHLSMITLTNWKCKTWHFEVSTSSVRWWKTRYILWNTWIGQIIHNRIVNSYDSFPVILHSGLDEEIKRREGTPPQ